MCTLLLPLRSHLADDGGGREMVSQRRLATEEDDLHLVDVNLYLFCPSLLFFD